MNSFLDENKIYKSGKMQEGRSGNTVVHMRRIPVNKAVAKMVQEFVRNERKERRHVTGRQLVDFFISKDLLNVNKENGLYNKKEFETAC